MSELIDKESIIRFWNSSSCGEIYADNRQNLLENYRLQAQKRYQLEPYLLEFANFNDAHNKICLEIGVGMGADHEKISKIGPYQLIGIDFSERAISHSKKRLELAGLKSQLQVEDGESLSFVNNYFDWIYSWGVIHHSPNTEKAVTEIFRVLKPGGIAKIMIYHKYSIVGGLLWIRYALLKGKPFTDLDYIYSHYLESPGTKAYSLDQANSLFSDFIKVDIQVCLSFGDLLQGEVGQRHRGWPLSIAKKLWPRKLICLIARRWNLGLYLLITAKK